MKKTIAIILAAFTVVSCMSSGGGIKYGSGTFRGKWWNYYDRGIALAELQDLEKAESDLKEAISRREMDQRMARTYGMHFIDYFPHRELGIVYFKKGDMDGAVRELEESISHEESAKAVFYLNRTRKQQLLNEGIEPEPPLIKVHSLPDGGVVNNFTMKVKGEISGQGYISKILVNDVPYRFDLAKKSIEFEKEISIDEDTGRITVIAEDLLGNLSVETIPLTVDRTGPTINIFDVVSGSVNGDDGIRITGEVIDGTGLSSLEINGIRKKVHETKSYEFDITMKKESLSGVFVIEASDILNNTTTAELDPEKELIAFRSGAEPFLIASAVDKLFSFDEQPPEISVKEADGLPAVFVDKFYVEGDVFDNKGVEDITVNGRSIQSKRGRKIFFSKLLGLNEGDNEIAVEAYDSAGNKARADFTVKRNIPEALQVGSRMSVSVLPFDIGEKDIPAAELAYEQLIGSFVEQKRFSVIERTKLEQVLLEQKLTREKLTDPRYSIEVGRIMAADSILATKVSETGKSIEFISRVINTETSEVMEVKDVYSEDKSFSSIKQLMEGLASKIAASFPMVKGMIIKRDGETIFVDIGSKDRIKRDMEVIAYRKGEEIVHPVTGKSLGWDTTGLGEGRIEDIYEDFSKAKLSAEPAKQDIAVSDMVITK